MEGSRRGRSSVGSRLRAAAPAEAPREEAPLGEWPLDMDLPDYVPEKAGELLELVVVGAGPAGLAVAFRVASFGYKVVLVDPEPLSR